jgi:hypothetical protein
MSNEVLEEARAQRAAKKSVNEARKDVKEFKDELSRKKGKRQRKS